MSDAWQRILLAVVCSSVTVTQQCGVVGGLTKIVGGESVGSLQYPWYVALVSSSGSPTLQVSCGGSLITSRHVLSAAHCFPRTSGVRPEKMYKAVLGLVDRCGAEGADQAVIARVRIHPDFNSKTLQADVSVLTLQRAVSYTPVCLPPRNFQPSGPAVIIGFGSTLVKSQSQYPCTLQQAQVNILSRRQCARSSLSPEYSHVPGTICAGVPSGGVDSCDGDSGGPIMTVGQSGSYVVQGIVSFGEGCARKNLPGVYTKVSAYRDFIDSAVSTEDGEGEDTSSTDIPLDTDDPATLTPTPADSTPSPPLSLLDSLLALVTSWFDLDSAAGSSSGGGSSAASVGSSGTGTTRPLSRWEYFLLQLFNRNHRRRDRPANDWALE